MIAFDTNLLTRLVVEDDLAQWRLADQLLNRCVEDDEQCLIGIPVLCETVWVLRKVYRASRDDIALTLESLLDDEVFEIEQREAVAEALQRFREGRADFSDYLIGVKNSLLNASTTYTFDRGRPERRPLVVPDRSRLPVLTASAPLLRHRPSL